jgi:N-acetylglucosamine-6-sulfatase
MSGGGSDGRPVLSRREVLRRLGAAGLTVAGGGAALTACGDESDGAAARRQVDRRRADRRDDRTTRPGIILIMADDMRYDHLQFMPNVNRLLVQEGRSFTQARCNVPLCQPSRVQLLTGQLSKHNGELGIGFGPTQLKDHGNTMPVWMADAGYASGLFGKYVNAVDSYGGIDSPRGYSVWREFLRSESAYEFSVHTESAVEKISGRYLSDYLADELLAFLGGADTPTLSVVTPTDPHHPFWPREEYADDWLDFVWPIVEDADVSDKPSWIRELPPLSESDKEAVRANVVGTLQELNAVDDMVARIIGGLAPDVLAETVIIFTSDNGVFQGEHRNPEPASKSGPYDVCLRVPLVVRGPGFEPGPDVEVPCLAMQDITATILDLGNATPGLPEQAGISLRQLCDDPRAHEDRTLLHEIGNGWATSGDGITTGPGGSVGFRKLYRYPSVRQSASGPFSYEAYDLDEDPDEHHNWAEDRSRRQERDSLEERLESLL